MQTVVCWSTHNRQTNMIHCSYITIGICCNKSYLLPLLYCSKRNFLLAHCWPRIALLFCPNMIIIWMANALTHCVDGVPCVFQITTITNRHTRHVHIRRRFFIFNVCVCEYFILITFSNGNNGTKISRNTSTPFHNLSHTHTHIAHIAQHIDNTPYTCGLNIVWANWYLFCGFIFIFKFCCVHFVWTHTHKCCIAFNDTSMMRLFILWIFKIPVWYF